LDNGYLLIWRERFQRYTQVKNSL